MIDIYEPYRYRENEGLAVGGVLDGTIAVSEGLHMRVVKEDTTLKAGEVEPDLDSCFDIYHVSLVGILPVDINHLLVDGRVIWRHNDLTFQDVLDRLLQDAERS